MYIFYHRLTRINHELVSSLSTLYTIATTSGPRFTKIRKSNEFVRTIVKHRLNVFVDQKSFVRTFVKWAAVRTMMSNIYLFFSADPLPKMRSGKIHKESCVKTWRAKSQIVTI